MSSGAYVLLAVLAAVLAYGLLRRRTDGRIRVPAASTGVSGSAAESLTSDDLAGATLGEQVTFVQFSTAFCQPCRATRTLLEQVSASHPGVAHVEIDAESHLDLVRRFDVMRTPTVLVLDGEGVIRGRATGVPRRDQIERTITSLSS